MARTISPDQLDPRNALELYSRDALRNADFWNDKLIREEYSRLRDIARKRLQRLRIAEPESWAYTKYKSAFAPAREQSTEQLRQQLPSLARFIAAKTSTVSGIRQQERRAIETLQEHGYTGVTPANFRQFGQFMEEWRTKKLNHSYGSPDAVELFEWTQDREIPWEKIKGDFARWLQYSTKLQEWAESQEEKGRGISADDILERFDKMEEQRTARNRKARERRAQKKNRK